MTAFEKFKARQREKLFQTWPEQAPEFLRHLTPEQMREAWTESEKMEGMPDAELTPELVALRNMQKESEAKSFEAFIGMGKILLELKTRFPDETEFWQYVETHMHKARVDAELAMEAAQEQ